MESRSPQSETYRRVLDDHLELKAMMARIDEALKERKDFEGVCHLLGQLGDRLVAHFALEEEGGYFAEAVLHSPHLVAKANRLMAQHPKLSAKARTVLEGAQAEQASDGWWEETRKRFDEVRQLLLRHEQGEDALLQEAYVRDIGSHD